MSTLFNQGTAMDLCTILSSIRKCIGCHWELVQRQARLFMLAYCAPHLMSIEQRNGITQIKR